MTESDSSSVSGRDPSSSHLDESRSGEEMNVFVIASVPLKRWRFIVAVFAVIVLVAALYALVQPTVYTADVTVLPAEAEQRSPYLSDLAAGLPFGLGSAIESGGQEPRIITILESRSVLDSIVHDLSLDRRWNLGSRRSAAKRLKESTSIVSQKDGPIKVSVAVGDPELSARIANAYPRALNRVNARLGAETARQRAEYLERQLAMAQGDLEQTERQLANFQRGQPAVEQQASMTMTAAANLKEQIITKEAQVAMMRRFATPDNPTLQAEMAELSVLRSQLADITRGTGSRPEDFFLSFTEAPEVGLDFKRLMRELEKDERIFVSLTAGLVQARIDAGDDVPVVNVLDPAIEPTGPSGPNRRRILVLGGMTGLLLGFVGTFFVEWGKRARHNPANREFFESWGQLKRDVRSRVPGGFSRKH